MGWTSQRQRGNTVVALAHQSAFGTAASAAGSIVRAQCLSCEIRRGAAYIDPQGLTGSEFPRDTHTEVGTAPSATLRFYAGSRPFLAAILEHATHGQPTATSAAGDLLEAGDTAGVLTTWSLVGVRPGFNTSAGTPIIYVKLTDESPGAGQALVQLYSDSARTALVASGSGANSTTVTLAEQNSSGLSGTVALAAPSASNLTGITLTVARIRCARSSTIARYFTLFRDSGAELESVAGCTVASIKFSSVDRGSLLAEAEIAGAVYAIAIGASAISPVAAEREHFVHSRATVQYDGEEQSLLEIAHGIAHDIERPSAQSTTPEAVWKRGSRLLPIEMRQRFADESRTISTYMDWVQTTVTYTYASKELAFDYRHSKPVDADLPSTREAGWDDHRIALAARDNGSVDPFAITLDL